MMSDTEKLLLFLDGTAWEATEFELYGLTRFFIGQKQISSNIEPALPAIQADVSRS